MKRMIRCLVLSLMLLTMLPLQTFAAELLIPVGKIIGLQLHSGSVTVAAYDDTLGDAARSAGLRIGDEILSVDGVAVESAEDIRTVLNRCTAPVRITVRRGKITDTLQITPTLTDNGRKLGIYLRQGIAGIGTVTFYDPDTGRFGTLGHGVSDARGKLLEMTGGSAYEAAITAVEKGKCGQPGQLKGTADSEEAFGKLLRNTPQGVFGVTSRGWKGEPLPVADYEDIRTGKASIRCTVAGDTVQEYSVEILKIYPRDRSDSRNLLLRVTDPALIAATGGIVQGMSGSPILQDGKIIGAVTHVLVNDPTTGYGIFIENMLDAAS